MITVENLLDAYAIALDLWIDPELAILENGHPRENPTPEYADAIRKAVSVENAELRELVRDMGDAIVDWYDLMDGAFACESVYEDEKFAPLFDRMRELGVIE